MKRTSSSVLTVLMVGSSSTLLHPARGLSIVAPITPNTPRPRNGSFGAPLQRHHGARSIAPTALIIQTRIQQQQQQQPSCKTKAPTSPGTTATALPAGFALDPAVARASLSATAKLLSSIGLGAIAARKPNVLDKAAVSALSRLTYWVFQPAFLLCSVSRTLAGASTPGSGMPRSILALMPVAACLQIGLGSLVSLVTTKVTGLSGDEASDVRMCSTFANSGPLPLIFADALFGGMSIHDDVVACISFYLLAWSPLFWSYGRVILGTYDSNDDADDGGASQESGFVRELKKLLSPPVWGSILGVVVGAVPFLREMFMGPRGALVPLYGGLKTLGTAYLPAVVLVLAGSLVGSRTSAVGSSSLSKRAVFSILFSRFCLAPLVSLALLFLFGTLDLIPSSQAGAVVAFVLLMEGCMPPAQNSVVMLQLEGLNERAGGIARTLALTYAVAVVPVTILLSACLSLSGIM